MKKLILSLLFFGAVALLYLGLQNPPTHGDSANLQATLVSDPAARRPQHVWLGADGEPFALQSHEELLEFLKKAKIRQRKSVGVGINRISKVLLERYGHRLHAAFRKVEVFKHQMRFADGRTELGFRDDAKFELAAYRLSRMLGLDNVPPTVVRKIGYDSGTLQVWVEKAFSEKDRLERDLSSPDPKGWIAQVQTMYVFDQLAANDDRNQGNILIDGNWKLWMIDHTRSFRRNREPHNLAIVNYCQRSFFERLGQLDPKTVRDQLKGVLTRQQIEALFLRRQILIDHLQSRIDRLGAEKVLL